MTPVSSLIEVDFKHQPEIDRGLGASKPTFRHFLMFLIKLSTMQASVPDVSPHVASHHPAASSHYIPSSHEFARDDDEFGRSKKDEGRATDVD
jgi:hypothetical protein